MKSRTTIILASIIAFVVIVSLIFNYLQNSPCNTIFEQTASQLKSKIKFIKAEGEISIGNKKIQDLTEASQLTALNLKTCCIVFHTGQLDSEQFLQCKDSAKKYDAKIENVMVQLDEIKKARETGNKAVIQEKIRQIDATVEEAKNISKTFKSKVETFQINKPNEKRKIKFLKEKEPNNDLFTPNNIPLNQWISGSIKDSSDSDYFIITTPITYRDIIKIELKNQTTTAKPRIGVYDRNKKWLGGTDGYSPSITVGQDQTYTFSSKQNTIYYICISFLGDTLGEYTLIVSPLKAYDNFEPNDDILNAETIQLGKSIEANFTDHLDKDYYRIKTTSKDGTVTVIFDNLSPHIKPRISVYDSNKRLLGGTEGYGPSITAGQNQTYSLKTKANSIYYISIKNLSNIPGPYRLRIKEK